MSEARTSSPIGVWAENRHADGGHVPRTCGRARLAGTLRTAHSVDAPGVLWTGLSRECPSGPVFTGEECENCLEWRGRTTPIAPLAGFEAVERTHASLGVVTLHRYDRGSTIVEQGGRTDALLTIMSGAVKRVTLLPSGKSVGIEVCGPGTPLGLEALAGDVPSPASVIALEETMCTSIPLPAMRALLRQHPVLARHLVREADERLQAVIARITDVVASRAEVRFARLFLELARTLGRRERGTIHVRIPLLRQDLADLTGTRLETCIRVMSRWNKRGIVRTSGHSFLIDDLRTVEAIGDGEAGPSSSRPAPSLRTH